MPADFKVGDRVTFADGISNQSIESHGYRRHDVLTVLEVEAIRLSDNAPACNCRLSGNAWFHGLALQHVDDAALRIKATLDQQVAVFKTMGEGFIALMEGQKAVSESLTALADAVAKNEEPEPAAAPGTSPFRIDGPGTYRTRDGRAAKVRSRGDHGSDWPWSGSLNGALAAQCWADDGSWGEPEDEDPRDLVEKLP